MSRNVRRSAEWWRELVAAQRDSGQTIRAFCMAQGIGKSTFGKWKRRLAGTLQTRQAAMPTASAPALFTPLTGEAEAASAGTDRWTIELDLGNGVCLRLRQAP